MKKKPVKRLDMGEMTKVGMWIMQHKDELLILRPTTEQLADQLTKELKFVVTGKNAATAKESLGLKWTPARVPSQHGFGTFKRRIDTVRDAVISLYNLTGNQVPQALLDLLDTNGGDQKEA